jgi:hypothetical protein
MRERRGSDLTVRVRIGDHGSECWVTRPGAEPIVVVGSLNIGRLAELRRNLSSDLDLFRSALGNELDQRENWDRLTEAFRILHRRGALLFIDLFGGPLAPMIATEFATILAAARKAKRYAVIDLNVPAPDCLPLEFLPVLNLRPPGRIKGKRDLEVTAASFLGFSAVVRREFPPWQSGKGGPASQTGQVPVIENDPKLPLKLFHCAALPGAASEADYFRTAKAHFELDGPWPAGRINPRSAVVKLARCMWNPWQPFRGKCRNRPDQIHHFACHFKLDVQNTEVSFLQFQGPHSPPVEVHLGDLKYQLLATQMGKKGPPSAFKPLVFANACQTSTIQPGAAASFPEVVLKNGNVGFIGTETAIPDKVACIFAQRFYENLLHGDTLGDSVMNAKHQLLLQYHNPLGILYVFYAEPDMRVRKPVPDLRREH